MAGLLKSATMAAALAMSGNALAAGPLPVDAPIPNDMKERVFLPASAVAGVRDKMERVVGYWAFVDKNGKIEVTTLRPASFTGESALTKVTLGSGKPSYETILTSSKDLNAAIPVLNFSWSTNQKGQVTITDSAQFVAKGDPTSTDWDNLPVPTNGGHWVFIDAATVSVVQTSVLTEKSGGLSALLQAFSIGGKNYQALSGTSSDLIVALFVKRNPLDLAAGLVTLKQASALAVTESSLNALSAQ